MTQTKAELLQTRHQGDIRLGDANSSHYVGFKAPATVSSSLVWTLPAADGTANYLLKTDGSGNLGWVADSSTDSTKMPLAGGTFTGDVTFQDTAQLQITTSSTSAYALRLTDAGVANYDFVFPDTSTIKVETNTGSTKQLELRNAGSGHFDFLLADNGKVKLGDSADLKIYHESSSTTNWIEAANGDTKIQCTDGDIYLNPKAGEVGLKAITDGAVELYHNNVKTFETDPAGIKVSGPEGDAAHIYMFADEGDDNADQWAILASAGGTFQIRNYSTGSWVDGLTLDSSNNATFASAIYGPAKAVSALQLDLSTGNYFTKTISGNSTFTFANPAASGTVTAFTLELTHSSGTVTWPSSVKFNNDTAPTLTTGKTHLFMFVTDDGGTRYRGSALVDYVN